MVSVPYSHPFRTYFGLLVVILANELKSIDESLFSMQDKADASETVLNTHRKNTFTLYYSQVASILISDPFDTYFGMLLVISAKLTKIHR